MTEEKKEVAVKEEPRLCSKKEKLGHALGVLGHDSANTLWSTWMIPFMTDILQLPAQFLLILTTAARFFDAFTDISMGVIADRTSTNASERVFRVRLNLKAGAYDKNKIYRLVIANDTDVPEEAEFHIDIAFADDFGFDL